MANVLNAEIREKKNPKELRRGGRIPGVVYGRDFHHEITLEQVELEKVLAKITRSSRISLKINGKEVPTFIKEIHYHPLTDRILHVDLFRPVEGQNVKLQVPLRYVGEPIGRKKGGVINRLRDMIEVNGPSDSIPEIIEFDISNLDVGDSFHASDVKLPANVQLLTPKEILLVKVMIPRKIEEVVATPAEGAVPGAEGAAPAEGAAAGAEAAKPGAAGKEEAPKAADEKKKGAKK